MMAPKCTKKHDARALHVPSCCFAIPNLLLFCRSRCRRRRRCLSSLLLWSNNFATMVTWRHTSPFYYFGQWKSNKPITSHVVVAQREKTPGEQVMIGLIWTSDWLRKWPAICQLIAESTKQAEKQSNCEITIDTKLKIAVLRDIPYLALQPALRLNISSWPERNLPNCLKTFRNLKTAAE